MTINNSINNSVGASNSGTTNTFTVSNASNTASSQAQANLSVGGTSSGDAWNQWTIGSTRSYSFGPDTSDSQTLKIQTSNSASVNPSSGTTLMTATSAGYFNYPLQSAFGATAGDQLTVTGDGTVYTVLFASERFDQNSNYSSPNFTAPVTGKYLLMTTVGLTGLTASHTSGIIQIVTTSKTYGSLDINIGAIRSASNNGQLNFYCIANMSASDTAEVRVIVSNGAKVVGIAGSQAFFYGCLLV
jgi:hypothetical protein